MLYNFLQTKGVIKPSKKGKVIDIGSGDGKEGVLFKKNGYKVISIDIKNGMDATTYKYPKNEYDIAIANNSLPFMGDKQLDVISNIYLALKNGGYFYGTVFGKDEPWAKEGFITPMDFTRLEKHLKKLGFQLIWESEEKGIAPTMRGKLKNWHIFKFLVRKTKTNNE